MSHGRQSKWNELGLTRVLVQGVGLYLLVACMPRAAWTISEFIGTQIRGDKPAIAWNWENLVFDGLRADLAQAAVGALLLIIPPRLLRNPRFRRWINPRCAS